MPRILLTGDRPLIRTALSLLVTSSNDFAVIGECANSVEAIGAAAAARPDVVVIDFDLDSRCAAAPQQLAQLVRAAKGCPVLLLTAQEDPKAIAVALQHGVRGIVIKTRNADMLLRAIRGVAAGEAWLEASLLAQVFGQNAASTDTEHPVQVGKLTRRELEIVELISLGLQNKKIAERLGISETTVRHHLTSIYDKLSVTNRLELMRHAYRGQIAAA